LGQASEVDGRLERSRVAGIVAEAGYRGRGWWTWQSRWRMEREAVEQEAPWQWREKGAPVVEAWKEKGGAGG
jgi:hypothetical protein